MQILSPPSNQKHLPSYLHPLYVEMQEDLTLVWDVWNELKGVKSTYLPKEEKEPPRAYKNRLVRSHFDSRFAPAICSFAGLLSKLNLTADAPQTIQDAADDTDQQGNSLKVFLVQADQLAMRDAGCGILVEFPPQPTDADGNPLIQSAAEEQQFGLRPYLVLVDRRDILNWDIAYRKGRPFINRVTIREQHLIPDGDFGCTVKIYYRVLRPGSYEVWEVVRDKSGGWQKVLVPEKSGVTNLDQVPLVWYSLSDRRLFQGKPPFLNLAELNIEHFQKRSSLNEILHKCNLPVPYRKGANPDKDGRFPPLVIGPNSVIDIPINGEFGFAEPSGNAIATTQADIDRLEQSMDRASLAFLTGGEAQRTATEVTIDSAQVQASITSMATIKKSCVEQILNLWVQYTAEQSAGSIDIDAKVMQLPLSADEARVILDAMGYQISRRLGLQKLNNAGWLPEDTNIDQELALTEVPPPEPVSVPPPQP